MLYSEQDLGQKIVLSEENDDDTLGQFTRREFTIVGIAKSVLYINYERGSTSVGSGSLSAFVYVLPEAFDFDYDTELYLRLTDRAGEIYSDEYKARIDDAEPWVTALAEQCADDRGTRLHDDAAETLADARETLDEKQQELADAKQKLEDAKQTLADAEQDVLDGEQKLADAKEEADRELADAYQKLVDGQKEIEENEQKLADARKELADGEQKLADAQAEYDDGAAKLAEAREELRKQFNETVGELQAGQAEIDKNQAQLDQKRAELAAQKAELEATKAQLEAALGSGQLSEDQKAQLQAQLAQVKAGLQKIEAAGPELDAAQQQIDAAQAELNAGSEEFGDGLEEANAEISENQKKLDEAKATLDEKNQELADAKQELADGEQQLADAKQELADGWADYYSGKAEAEQKIADAEAELADAKQQLTDGKQDIADAEVELSDGEQKLADAEQEYQDGQDALEKLENPDVFVLDRSSNIGYACFESDSDIVRGVSRVFPLFFFAVAALVCITTMTRMVDEQRTQAGVLKAMGYSNGAIFLVYFLYAGSASVLGCVVGIAAGSYFLPKMIWQGYNIMYGFTDILYAFDWPLALLSAGAYLLCALGTTWYVAHAELQRPAAELIRPKAPKAGKRILLERLPGLWNRIPFLHKVSIRNILRYKKRMIMMIIGIGGCTALLITGYGIRDSISSVVDYQYSEITRYDASVTFQHALNETERTAFAALCEEEAEEYLFVAERAPTPARAARSRRRTSSARRPAA
ncbi:MAG: FtsX-like permease family protein [Oscillospiraceae bacterium]